LWLKTNVSAAANVTRTLTKWLQTDVSWSENVSTSATARYNLTGLLANTQYNVYNFSSLAYTITTDASGALNFTIALNTTSREIRVQEGEAPKYYNNSTNNTVAGLPTKFSLNWTDNVGLNGYIFSTNNSGTWQNESWTPFYEDFTTYTEVDPSNHLNETSNQTNFTGSHNEDCYLYADKGVDHFTNWTHLIDAKLISQSGDAFAGFYVLANDIDDLGDFRKNGNTSISLLFYNSNVYLHEDYSGSYYEASNSVSIGTQYYVKIIKSGTSISAEFYSDAARTNLLFNLSLTLHANHKFRYIYAANNYNNYLGPPAGQSNVYINNLNLEELGAWSNVTKTLNTTVGLPIGWRVFVNDTTNNWNTSQIFSLTTTDSGQCQVMINNETIPYTITQNNTVYCLSQNIGKNGVNGINFANPTQNSTLDCRGYNIDSNDVASTYGVYLTGSSTKNNTVKNCNITDFDTGIYLNNGPNNNNITNNTLRDNDWFGIYLVSSSNNTFINNTINSNTRYGIRLDFTTDFNNITGGSIANNDYDYSFSSISSSNISNYFRNTNFTDARKIWFYSGSWFNYNNDTFGELWLKSKFYPVSTFNTLTLTRKLINWNQSSIKWNETVSSARNATYNITGLKENIYYNIYNNSVLTYTLQTDPSGNLPSFDIYLDSQREIKVEASCNYPDVGDWIINDNRICENVSITMNGNITIQNGGNLTFRNITLKMNNTQDAISNIEVQSGGKMFIYDLDINKDTTNDASTMNSNSWLTLAPNLK